VPVLPAVVDDAWHWVVNGVTVVVLHLETEQV
jgi:hypothetical protein